ENSDVLPFGFVAVAVIGLPLALDGKVTVTSPFESATPLARYVSPEPNEPAGWLAMKTSTLQLAHVTAVTLVGVLGVDSVGAIIASLTFGSALAAVFTAPNGARSIPSAV